MPYPKWLYHKELEAKVVHSEDEEKGLGGGWEESPAAFQLEGKEELDPVGLSGLKEDELIAYIKEQKLSKLSASKLKALSMAELRKIAEGK